MTTQRVRPFVVRMHPRIAMGVYESMKAVIRGRAYVTADTQTGMLHRQTRVLYLVAFLDLFAVSLLIPSLPSFLVSLNAGRG